jgi:hypothetical protein
MILKTLSKKSQKALKEVTKRRGYDPYLPTISTNKILSQNYDSWLKITFFGHCDQMRSLSRYATLFIPGFIAFFLSFFPKKNNCYIN